jgi:hypothetical protein
MSFGVKYYKGNKRGKFEGKRKKKRIDEGKIEVKKG